MSMIFVGKKKKAQAAMEFMMTYGWALLAILAILAALVYFGVQDVERFVPDHCVFLTGLNCMDSQVIASGNDTYPSTIRIAVRNEFGFDISNISITIEGTCDSVMNTTGEIAKVSLMNKETGTYGFACLELTGFDIQEKITFEFVNLDTGVNHRKVGYIDMKN